MSVLGVTESTCANCGKLWRSHGSGGHCPGLGPNGEIHTWKMAHRHEVFTRGLWALTTDDSQDEPSDFSCDDGMDD